jgi:hypothetical protein
MFDNNLLTKNFDILVSFFWLGDYAEKIKEQYNEDLHKEFSNWIKKEFDNNDLLKKINWAYFRDGTFNSDILIGYKKFFIYKNIYFMVSVVKDYENEKSFIHFVPSLYGLEEENKSTFTIPSDNSIPDKHWYSTSK